LKYPDDFLNKIICGDCLKILPFIPDNTIDLIVTSPPYNLGIDYGIYKDDLEWDKYYNWCKLWLAEIFRILKEDGRFCLNHYLSIGQTGNRQSPLMNLNTLALEVGLKHHALAIWTNSEITKLTAWGSWLSASAPHVNLPYEGILILYKHFWKKQYDGISTIGRKEFMESCSGIWDIQPSIHQPTPSNFPIQLAARCIKMFSFEKDIVGDPFVGSGTTAIASKNLRRKYFGIEINPDYCRIANQRLAQEMLFK